MNYLYEGDMSSKNRALLVSTSEWKRLNKLLTKKDDEMAIAKENKRIREERRTASQAMAQSWDSTTLNKRKKEIEYRRKLLADNEAKQLKRDEEIKLEIMERRKMIVEKARSKKWSEKDSTKTVTRAVYQTEILRERALQIEFNEAEKAKLMEEDHLLKIKQNLEAEQYRKDVWQQAIQRTETKKVKAAAFMEELKERDDNRRSEEFKLNEEGKAELKRIAEEIENEKEKEKVKIRTAKEKIWKNLIENRKIVEEKNELRQLEEQEENTVIAIMAEAKKRMAKTMKLKEMEILKEKQKLLEKMTEKSYKTLAKKENVANANIQKFIDEKERRYQIELQQKEEIKKKIKKDIEDSKAAFDEKARMEKQRLTLSRQWELERRLRETQVLRDLEESRERTKKDKKNKFQEHLDIQCYNNRAASLADKQVDRKQYNELIKLWRQEDEEFTKHTMNLINENKKMGKPVIPLFKVIKDYMKNNKLLADAASNNVEVIPNVPLGKAYEIVTDKK